MKYLDLSFATPEQNLACDEALLEWSEAGADTEVLRVWEAPSHFVVLGYANKAHTEIKLGACRGKKVPVLRRCSGGGTVLQGPGCLNYSLVMRIDESGPLGTISGVNEFIMQSHRKALASVLRADVAIEGHTDLAIGGKKFSGNAQRRKRRYLLFHGTFLLSFDLALIEMLLARPTQQPAYRQQRSHLDFLTNLELTPTRLKELLRKTWTTGADLERVPLEAIEILASHKYSLDSWTFKFG